MPLRDHFHPPLSTTRNWESFHSLWAAAIVADLNESLLPEGFFAETQIHVGGVEVDVANFEENGAAGRPVPGNGGVAVATWAPPAPALTMPAVFPDELEIQVFKMSGGATLVGAIELVSPGNKDRPETRRAFAAKCAAYLHQGVGLVIVDVVTERRANLHDELIDLLRQAPTKVFPGPGALYAAGYRPIRRESQGAIDVWPFPLAVGQPLPTVPLALTNGPVLPVDLEASYQETLGKARLA